MNKSFYVYVNADGTIHDYEETSDTIKQMADSCAEYNSTESLHTGLKKYMIVKAKDGMTPTIGKQFLEESNRIMKNVDANVTEKGLDDLNTALKVLFALHQTVKSTEGMFPDGKDKELGEAILLVGGFIAKLAAMSKQKFEENKTKTDKTAHA